MSELSKFYCFMVLIINVITVFLVVYDIRAWVVYFIIAHVSSAVCWFCIMGVDDEGRRI